MERVKISGVRQRVDKGIDPNSEVTKVSFLQMVFKDAFVLNKFEFAFSSWIWNQNNFESLEF